MKISALQLVPVRRNRVLADSRVTNWRQVGTALGLCIARNESRDCCCVFFQGLARRSRRVRRRFVRGSREISLAIPMRYNYGV